MHIHASVLDALIVFAMVALVGFAWKTVAAKYHDRPVGQAMAAIYA